MELAALRAAGRAPASVALRARAGGLSLGHGSRRRWCQDDVDFAGAVDADDEVLLDVRAPARARDDRERARQVVADRLEQFGKPGEDPILGQQRHVDGRQQRPSTRLLPRRGEHDAARVCEPVQGGREARALVRKTKRRATIWLAYWPHKSS